MCVIHFLNDHIHPVHSKNTTYKEICIFLARWKYFVLFDLTNSYFQIPLKKELWPYMAVMTPHRGIKILTRAGQGLQNSDTELEQLICQILGDEIHSGSTLVARDDGLVGVNSIYEN